MTPQDLMKNYEQALASQDWKSIEPLMHPDVCVTFSTGTFKGISAVREVFEKNFASIKDEEYSIMDLHWVFVGKESATCLYTFHWQGLINNQPASGSGRGTAVLINTAGVWQILTEHLGPNAP